MSWKVILKYISWANALEGLVSRSSLLVLWLFDTLDPWFAGLHGPSLGVDSSLSEPDCSANAVLCVLGGHPSSSQASAAIFMRFLEREHVMVNILHEQQTRKKKNTLIAGIMWF